MYPSLARILTSASQAVPLTLSEAEEFLPFLRENPPDAFATARIAASAGGATPFTCGIINAKSGHCTENCSFCAQSAHHDVAAPVHPLLRESKILEYAHVLAEAGVHYMGIVISGAKPSPEDFSRICAMARRIIEATGIRLCASLGILTLEQAICLKQAGFTSCHHNLETARSYYGEVCTTHSFEARLATVANAREAGLRVCSGGIFGLGESWRHRLELAVTLSELDVDSIPVNFLTPVKGTPLENAPSLDPLEALTIVALLRLMHPKRDIVICGGRSRTLAEWENSLFFAGANGLMVGDYLTTEGSPLERDMRLLRDMGFR